MTKKREPVSIQTLKKIGKGIGVENKTVRRIDILVQSLGTLDNQKLHAVWYTSGPGEHIVGGDQLFHIEVPQGQSLDDTLREAAPEKFTTNWGKGDHDGQTLRREFSNARGR